MIIASLRSPREIMCGWMQLPRYIDKIRLFQAEKLDPSYLPYFGKSTDGLWLAAAGVTHEQMLQVVDDSITDGEVCDWVRLNVKKSEAEKAAFNRNLVERPNPGNAEEVQQFEARKAAYKLTHRTDITRFIDLIDADEGRLPDPQVESAAAAHA